jgi:hypothetical protein
LTKCFSVTHRAAIEFNTGSVHACSGRNNTQNPVNERYGDVSTATRDIVTLAGDANCFACQLVSH